MENRRRHARASLDTRVWIGQDGIFTQTDERLSDLSVGGAFVELREQGYAVGDILTIRFRLDNGFITSTVIVRHARAGHGIGVEFLDIADDARERIADFVTVQLGDQR